MACPLYEPDYLLSVVDTIADSRSTPSLPAVHVLLDAYTTFVNRVRYQSHVLESCNTPLPALAPLNHRRDDLVHVLRRDIRLAHIDPLARSTLDDSIKLDTKQYARDSSAVCHHALCTIATIFRFPVFCSAFSEHDLASLFGDVLDIALAGKLPIFNEAKTYSLSLWALACHRLPLTAITPRRDDLCLALRQSLNSARQPDYVLDGLKAVSHTIERHPSTFLDLLFPLLPYVISNLDRKSLDHRLHASIALGKFANAFVSHSGLSLTKWQSQSNQIISFLESCSNESQLTSWTTNFLSVVRASLSAESHTLHTEPPSWIFTVLASLIVLCGPTLFAKPLVSHVILQSLAIILTHKRSMVRALHPHIWRCFVWTFGRMLSSSENLEPAAISSAFYVIKQEVGGGVGVALTSVLLSDRISTTESGERGDRISRALSVIKVMVRTGCKHTRREGFMYLRALAGDAQTRHQIQEITDEIPASVLLNGAIIRVDWDTLSSIVHSIPKVQISVNWPEEREIVPHYKTLLMLWRHFTSQADRRDSSLSLLDVWLSILLLCSHQLECEQRTTGTVEMLKHTAMIIVDFLPPVTSGDSHADWGSWSVDDQLCCLTFIDQLWSSMRRAFIGHSLAEVAELILTSVLKYAFHVLDPSIRTLWGNLCVNLMTTAPSSFLCGLHESTAPPLVIRSQRELWGVLATSLPSSEGGPDWKELVKFLAIPVCAWTLSAPELEAWESLLRNTITRAGDSTMVVEHVLQQLQGKAVEEWDSVTAILSFLLISALEHGISQADELLSMADVCLTISYGQACNSVLTHSLQLLKVIRQTISSSPANVIYILQALGSSICLWIEDHGEIMSDDQFNSVAVSLYCEALQALETLPLSIEVLQKTETFLASAFSRIPSPAIAPFAFERFWRATYYGQSQFYGDLPPKIRSCLSCFVEAYGGDLADGLPVMTESQSQSISADSQDQSLVAHRQPNPGTEIVLPDLEYVFTGQEDGSLLLPSPEEEMPEPAILRQTREHGRMDASFLNDSEGSISSPWMPFSPNDAIRGPPSPENIHLFAIDRKRKLAEIVDTPQKHGGTSGSTLRSVQRVESEPATRDVTPVDVPRMSSVPLKRRKVFDGVEVPAFRANARRQRAETSNRVVRIGQAQDMAATSRRVRRKRASQATVIPSSMRSKEDEFEWENDRVSDGMSSEADVDRSLAHVLTSSPPVSELQGLLPESSLAKAQVRSEGPAALPTVQPASRLSALQDVYSSLANGASQIPLSELVQATRLVHQIGAVLTEQMSKKFHGDPR